MIASGMIADPGNAMQLIALYGAAAQGDFSPIGALLGYFYTPGDPIDWSAMPLAMDRASGISAQRLAQVREEATTSLLGDYLNFPMPHVIDELGALDLGDGFARGRSAIPRRSSLQGRSMAAPIPMASARRRRG